MEEQSTLGGNERPARRKFDAAKFALDNGLELVAVNFFLVSNRMGSARTATRSWRADADLHAAVPQRCPRGLNGDSVAGLKEVCQPARGVCNRGEVIAIFVFLLRSESRMTRLASWAATNEHSVPPSAIDRRPAPLA